MWPKLAQICGDLLGSDTCVARISGDYVKQCHAGTLSESCREVFWKLLQPWLHPSRCSSASAQVPDSLGGD